MKHREFTYRGVDFIDKKAYLAALELIERLEKALKFGIKIFDDKADGMGEVACIEHMMMAIADIKKFREGL